MRICAQDRDGYNDCVRTGEEHEHVEAASKGCFQIMLQGVNGQVMKSQLMKEVRCGVVVDECTKAS